jgi:ubiquinone/menaquinone biosynthesis C-methylase UbiE
MVDLTNAKSLLDVGGGTEAMTIRLLEVNPDLVSTIIDFPNVSEIGWRFITEAKMVDRVRYIPSNALSVEWPKEQDAILMTHLFSEVPGEEEPRLVQYAFDCLAPSGAFMVHDFMVKDDRTGPPMAALWQLITDHQSPRLFQYLKYLTNIAPLNSFSYRRKQYLKWNWGVAWKTRTLLHRYFFRYH